MTTRQITLDIPDKVLLAEKTDEASFARELRLLAAVKLYELGRLSSGRAAELAGMPRAVWTSSEIGLTGGHTDWDAALESNGFSRPMSAAVKPTTSPASFAPTINVPPPELANATNSAASESTLLMFSLN